MPSCKTAQRVLVITSQSAADMASSLFLRFSVNFFKQLIPNFRNVWFSSTAVLPSHPRHLALVNTLLSFEISFHLSLSFMINSSDRTLLSFCTWLIFVISITMLCYSSVVRSHHWLLYLFSYITPFFLPTRRFYTSFWCIQSWNTTFHTYHHISCIWTRQILRLRCMEPLTYLSKKLGIFLWSCTVGRVRMNT